MEKFAVGCCTTSNEERMIKALHKTIFENEIPAKKIAKELNIQYKTLSKMCNEDSLLPSNPKFPLVKLPKLAELVDISLIVEEICRIAGYMPAKVDDINYEKGAANPINVLRKTQHASKQMASTVEEVINALEDGILTKEEYQMLKTHLSKLKEAVLSLESYLDIIYFLT